MDQLDFLLRSLGLKRRIERRVKRRAGMWHRCLRRKEPNIHAVDGRDEAEIRGLHYEILRRRHAPRRERPKKSAQLDLRENLSAQLHQAQQAGRCPWYWDIGERIDSFADRCERQRKAALSESKDAVVVHSHIS